MLLEYRFKKQLIFVAETINVITFILQQMYPVLCMILLIKQNSYKYIIIQFFYRDSLLLVNIFLSSLTEEYTEEEPAYTVQKISYKIIYRKGVNTSLIKIWSLHLFPFTDMSQLLLHDTISQGDQVGYLIFIISFKHTYMFAVLFTLKLFVS